MFKNIKINLLFFTFLFLQSNHLLSMQEGTPFEPLYSTFNCADIQSQLSKESLLSHIEISDFRETHTDNGYKCFEAIVLDESSNKMGGIAITFSEFDGHYSFQNMKTKIVEIPPECRFWETTNSPELSYQRPPTFQSLSDSSPTSSSLNPGQGRFGLRATIGNNRPPRPSAPKLTDQEQYLQDLIYKKQLLLEQLNENKLYHNLKPYEKTNIEFRLEEIDRILLPASSGQPIPPQPSIPATSGVLVISAEYSKKLNSLEKKTSELKKDLSKESMVDAQKKQASEAWLEQQRKSKAKLDESREKRKQEKERQKQRLKDEEDAQKADQQRQEDALLKDAKKRWAKYEEMLTSCGFGEKQFPNLSFEERMELKRQSDLERSKTPRSPRIPPNYTPKDQIQQKARLLQPNTRTTQQQEELRKRGEQFRDVCKNPKRRTTNLTSGTPESTIPKDEADPFDIEGVRKKLKEEIQKITNSNTTTKPLRERILEITRDRERIPHKQPPAPKRRRIEEKSFFDKTVEASGVFAKKTFDVGAQAVKAGFVEGTAQACGALAEHLLFGPKQTFHPGFSQCPFPSFENPCAGEFKHPCEGMFRHPCAETFGHYNPFGCDFGISSTTKRIQ